jgi:outer membrane lipoprotein SlyB
VAVRADLPESKPGTSNNKEVKMMFLMSAILTGATLGNLLGATVSAITGAASATSIGTLAGAGTGLIAGAIELAEEMEIL